MSNKSYTKIYQKLQSIGSTDMTFYCSNVLYYQVIASILIENFEYYEDFILNSMEELHFQHPKLNMDKLFIKAIKDGEYI